MIEELVRCGRNTWDFRGGLAALVSGWGLGLFYHQICMISTCDFVFFLDRVSKNVLLTFMYSEISGGL
jgi:hypothetical protein